MFVIPCRENASILTMEVDCGYTSLLHRGWCRRICDAFPNRYDDGVHTTSGG
jgi:hypothetical protein